MAALECRSILWVQDWALTGAGLGLEFERLGFDLVGPFRQPCRALDWIATHRPFFAVLALKFQDGPSVVMARELWRRRLPFAFLSGSPSLRPLIEEEFPRAPWIEAPAKAGQVLESLSRCDIGRRAA